MNGAGPAAGCPALLSTPSLLRSSLSPVVRRGWLLTCRRHIDLLRVCSASH